jgi:opacity protein-like surface antigen
MKNTLIAVMVVAVVSTASAQKFIPRFGASVFKVTGEEVPDSAGTSSLLGLTLGIGYQVPINDRFSFQPELNFVQKGIKSDFDLEQDGQSFKGTIKLVIDYLEIPLLVKATFGSTTKYFILAGPSLGYGIGGRVKYKLITNDPLIGTTSGQTGIEFGEQPENYDGSNVYISNRIDFGIQGGAGVLIANKVFIDIRYSLGLSDVQDGYDSKNRGLLFTVGMPFNIKK